MFKYLNRFTTASARGLFNYDLNDRTRNKGAKLIVKHFNTSVAQHFGPIKITTTWNALPSELVSSRTVSTFQNIRDKHWAENPPNVRVNWYQSSMPCTIQVCTNSRRPAICWKWTQRSVLLLQESQQLMMMSSIHCWKKFCYHNMNASSWETLIFQT